MTDKGVSSAGPVTQMDAKVTYGQGSHYHGSTYASSGLYTYGEGQSRAALPEDPHAKGGSEAWQADVFIGRKRELSELHQYLALALSGHGQVCFVTGQAGSGKTALIHRFVQQALVADTSLIVAAGSCNAQTGISDPYLPFREALAMLTGTDSARHTSGAIAPENAVRLQTVMVRAVQVLVEVAPELIGVFVPGAALVGHLGRAVTKKVGWMDRLDDLANRKVGAGEPAAEQSRVFEQYTAFLQQLSAKAPLIIFLDDLQWADSASIGLLFQLGRHIHNNRILIVGAYRPNDVALGRGGERHPLEPVVHELTRYHGDVTIDLDTIPESVSRDFVDALLDAQPNRLGPSFRQVLFRRTGGHALFTVELVRHMQERGDLVRDDDGTWAEGSSLDWNELPVRVEGVIAERIDRLSDELRQLLTVASVEGEQFTAEVVARVQAISEREAVRDLSDDLQRQHRLVSAQGLVRLGPVHLSLYRFLHNLFQQYLYGSLGAAERAYLHRDVGEALEALLAGNTEEVAAQLARHFEEAGLPGKAALYRLQAGNRARRMSAHLEAEVHLTRGLELVAHLPPGPERLQLELGLQSSLGLARMATQGYASSEVEQAFGRARELCRALGDPPQLFQVLYGQLVFHFVRGDLERVRQEGEELLQRALASTDIAHVIGCHTLLGATAVYRADYVNARQHLEQALSLYDPVQHRDLAYQQGQDPGVVALSYLAWDLWFEGYLDQAVAKANAALRLADELDHALSRTVATFFAGWLQQALRRWPEAEATMETTLELANQAHYALWQAYGNIHHGAALVHQGHTDEGLSELLQGSKAREAAGTKLGTAGHLAFVAGAYLDAGLRDAGLSTLDQADVSLETWLLAELLRVRAELLLLETGAENEAEALLWEALEVARSQGAKSLELRAALSLARLLGQLGRAAEGQGLVAKCYAWFSEGFDTPDLREARDLLGEMSGGG